VWVYYPEAAGSTLESIDVFFTNTDELDTKRSFYHHLQWSVVYQAKEVMQRHEMKREELRADRQETHVFGCMRDAEHESTIIHVGHQIPIDQAHSNGELQGDK